MPLFTYPLLLWSFQLYTSLLFLLFFTSFLLMFFLFDVVTVPIYRGVLRSSPSLCLNHQPLFSLQSLDVGVITVHWKAALSLRSPWFYRHSCCRVVQSCAKRKVLSKEMWSVIALHHRELSKTEAHSHVISYNLSDGATIINREVMCSLSSYLCCKVCLLLFVSLNLWSLCLCSFLKNGPCFVADSSTVVSLFWFV